MMPMAWGMGGGWGLFGFLFMAIFWVLLIVGVVLLIRWLVEQSRPQPSGGEESPAVSPYSGEHHGEAISDPQPRPDRRWRRRSAHDFVRRRVGSGLGPGDDGTRNDGWMGRRAKPQGPIRIERGADLLHGSQRQKRPNPRLGWPDVGPDARGRLCGMPRRARARRRPGHDGHCNPSGYSLRGIDEGEARGGRRDAGAPSL